MSDNDFQRFQSVRGRFLRALTLFLLPLFAWGFSSPYVYNPHAQLVPKTEAFVHLLANELREKTGVSLYIAAYEKLQEYDVKAQEEELIKGFRRPYILLFFTKNEKKIDIIASEEAETMFDKKDVYWNYIVPLLPRKDEELDPPRISAVLLNGYVQIADSIALSAGVKLEHTFTPEDRGTRTFVRMLLYFMTFSLLLLFLFRMLRRRA